MAVWAIGDVQGCAPELRALVRRIRFNPDRDRLWLVGDLVNRGGASLSVLRYVHALRDNVTLVLGNHDLHLLALAAGVTQRRREKELTAVTKAKDADALVSWLTAQPLVVADRDVGWAMVHAGLDPRWSLKRALKEAAVVERQLRTNPAQLLKRMYGNRPHTWSDSLPRWARIRASINVMTRLRFCDLKGRLSHTASGPPDAAPDNMYPWFEVPGRKKPAMPVVFGHWSALGLLSRRRYLGLDTACVWGGHLTAARLDGDLRHITQVRAKPARRS